MPCVWDSEIQLFTLVFLVFFVAVHTHTRHERNERASSILSRLEQYEPILDPPGRPTRLLLDWLLDLVPIDLLQYFMSPDCLHATGIPLGIRPSHHSRRSLPTGFVVIRREDV
jgi:hypothetical protein